MELSWLMKSRIVAAMAAGALLIGVLAWPIAAPADPFGPVSVAVGDITFAGAAALMILAFVAGLLACLICWPYGREIAVLAVPTGLAVWAIRTGNMANLMQQNLAWQQRQAVLSAIKWEPFFWLIVVAVGFLGVRVGLHLAPPKAENDTNFSNTPKKNKPQEKAKLRLDRYLTLALALIGSAMIAHFCIGFLARDVGLADSKLGHVVSQPPVGQIFFAVFVAFGLAGFVVKKFLNCGYIWTTMACGIVTAFAITSYAKQASIEVLAARYPAVFFTNSALSILPVQMVAFGVLGAISGYWLAIRYKYWRTHEMR